ncbi:hypothetical protein D3C87_1689950 [compost metagenome]
MEDLDDLRPQVAAAALDAKPHADIIGVGNLVRGLEKVHNDKLGQKAGRGVPVRPVAIARRFVVQGLGRLDDRLALGGRDGQGGVVVEHPRHRGRRHANALGDFLDSDHAVIPLLSSGHCCHRATMPHPADFRNRF